MLFGRNWSAREKCLAAVSVSDARRADSPNRHSDLQEMQLSSVAAFLHAYATTGALTIQEAFSFGSPRSLDTPSDN